MKKNSVKLITILSVITMAQPLFGMNLSELKGNPNTITRTTHPDVTTAKHLSNEQPQNSSLKRIFELDLNPEQPDQKIKKHAFECPRCSEQCDDAFRLNTHAQICYQKHLPEEALYNTRNKPSTLQKPLTIVPYTKYHYLKARNKKSLIFIAYQPKTLQCEVCKKAYAEAYELQIHKDYECRKNNQ